MPADFQGICAYAPSGNVLTVIHQVRDRGLKEPVNMQLITMAGVAEGNASRTIQALRFLDLIDEEGYLTENFKVLRNASSEEYPSVLGDILKEAYSRVFMVLDPATANDEQLLNAFRFYEPRAQRARMISLFKGLCREAQLITGSSEAPRRTRSAPTGKSSASSINGRKASITERPAPLIVPDSPLVSSQMQPLPSSSIAQEYALLINLLQQLPKGEEKQWSSARRERWIQAVTASVDLLIEVEDEG
jgi:hypothetical protein